MRQPSSCIPCTKLTMRSDQKHFALEMCSKRIHWLLENVSDFSKTVRESVHDREMHDGEHFRRSDPPALVTPEVAAANEEQGGRATLATCGGHCETLTVSVCALRVEHQTDQKKRLHLRGYHLRSMRRMQGEVVCRQSPKKVALPGPFSFGGPLLISSSRSSPCMGRHFSALVCRLVQRLLCQSAYESGTHRTLQLLPEYVAAHAAQEAHMNPPTFHPYSNFPF